MRVLGVRSVAGVVAVSGDARLVWFFAGRLVMTPPQAAGSLMYHRLSKREWDRTLCGKRANQQFGPFVAMRRDTADLIADECRGCFGGSDD